MVYILFLNQTTQTLTMSNTQKVPYEGLKAIYDVACDTWKQKIEKMTKVFSDTILTEAQVTEMFGAASQEQVKTLNLWLREPGDIDKALIQEKLDALTLPYRSKTLTKEQKSVNALVQMFIIAEVMNAGTELTWKDTSMYKYFPYKYYSDGSWSVDYHGHYFDASFCSGVCFKSSKLALKAYEMFPQIYDDHSMINE